MLVPPFRLEQRDLIDSSNDEARRLALAGHGHGTVIVAAEQTAGRGRRGRAWMSPRGNLHCSILLDKAADAAASPQLAFVAAIALCDTLAGLTATANFQVKWPNDVLCGGAKIAGMLLEQAGDLIILGVGVNIVAHPALALYPTTCLRHSGSGAGEVDVLATFCDHLAVRDLLWRQQGFAPIRRAWLERAMGLGEAITARLADDRTLSGRFIGLAEDGALELADEQGAVQRIVAGDVFFKSAFGEGADGDH